MDWFSISINQATHDFSAYLAIAPDNLAYSRQSRTYERQPGFRSLFGADDPQAFLNEILMKAMGLMDSRDGVVMKPPPVGTLGLPVRSCAAPVLRDILAAIRSQRSISILYQSMSRPEPMRRSIAPHALGWDGFRWHVRAWCDVKEDYLDFVLGRVFESTPGSQAKQTAEHDEKWHETVQLDIVPHPGLSKAQQKAVELDYGMTDGVLKLIARRAMLHYVRQRFGLDVDPAHRAPNMQHIVERKI